MRGINYKTAISRGRSLLAALPAVALGASLLLVAVPSHSQVPAGTWSVKMTATGGELGSAISTAEVAFSQGVASATRSLSTETQTSG